MKSLQLKITSSYVLFQAFQNYLKSYSLCRTLSDTTSKNDGEGIRYTDQIELDAPIPPNDEDCCKEGCSNCVWLEYVTRVKFHYKDSDKIKEALNVIPEGDIKEFVKLELKQLMEGNWH